MSTKVLKIFGFLLSALLLFCAAPAHAQEASSEHQYSIGEIREHWKTLHDLERRGVLTHEQVAEQQQFYLAKASALAGEQLTSETLATWSTRESVIQFSQVLRWIGIVVAIIAVVSLFGIYFFFLVELIPPILWEVLLYVGTLAMLYGTPNPWVRFPGAMIFGATLLLTRHNHFRKSSSDTLHFVFALVCMVAWGGSAALHQSVELGFLAVMAAVTALGFTVLVDPLCIGIGFRDGKKYLARGTFGSLGLLVAGVYGDHLQHPILSAFVPGLIAVGGFVYFVGILIMSSKWVASSRSYVIMQILALASGFGAFYLGPVLGLSWLTGVGGTLFCLYLLEKYIEIPWGKVGYAWGALLFGVVLYRMAMFIHNHPQYFLIHW